MSRTNWRALLLGVLAGLLVLLVMLILPITGHHGDGEQGCGSVLRHAQASTAVPQVVEGAPAPTAELIDACPAEDYQHRVSLALGTASVVAAGAFVLLAVRRRRREALA